MKIVRFAGMPTLVLKDSITIRELQSIAYCVLRSDLWLRNTQYEAGSELKL